MQVLWGGVSVDPSAEMRPGEEELLGFLNLKHNLLSETGAGGPSSRTGDTRLGATPVASLFP